MRASCMHAAPVDCLALCQRFHGTLAKAILACLPRVKGCNAVQMQQENGVGGAESPGGKRKGPPLTEEERRIRRKEINRESARRIRRRKNNEMDNLKQQARPCLLPVRGAVLTAAHHYDRRIAPGG